MSVSRLEECTRTPATAHVESHLKARRRDSGGLAAVTHPSSDTATADNVKSVAGCATCEAPTSGDTATCRTCLDGYYNSGTNSVTCTACDNACATCSGDGANKCTSCKEADKYLKTDSSAGTSQCVTEAACKQGGTHFPATDANQKKICTLCGDAANGGIDGCTTCTKESTTLKCLTCTTQTNKSNKAGTKYFDCQVIGCSHCSADGVCEACSDGKKVSPGGSSCVPNCPGNSSEQSGVCVCSSGFAPSGDRCVASSNPNLSTGAIAGISVAAVVVVGDLVSFLCWWFVCRGKA